MSGFFWFVSMLLAVFIGVSFTLRIAEHYLTQSNNVGDSTGKFSDFSSGFEVVGQASPPDRNKTKEEERIEKVLQK